MKKPAKIKNLSNLPKRKVTVEDILYREDIEVVLADINKDKESYTELLAITACDDGTIQWRHSNLPDSRMIYMMEIVKKDLLETVEEDKWR